LGTENEGSDIRRADSSQDLEKMSREEQDHLVIAKAAAARSTAEACIQTGMAPCVAWPRAIREEILERDSD